jgi:hypothetical protein
VASIGGHLDVHHHHLPVDIHLLVYKIPFPNLCEARGIGAKNVLSLYKLSMGTLNSFTRTEGKIVYKNTHNNTRYSMYALVFFQTSRISYDRVDIPVVFSVDKTLPNILNVKACDIYKAT